MNKKQLSLINMELFFQLTKHMNKNLKYILHLCKNEQKGQSLIEILIVLHYQQYYFLLFLLDYILLMEGNRNKTNEFRQ
jgi:hypothetical protein